MSYRHLTACTLAAALAASPSSAQPSGFPEADAAAPDPLLPELSIEAPSPFEAGTTLDSHPLRGVRPEVINQILTAEIGGEMAIEALAVPLPGVVGNEPLVALFVEIDGPSFLGHNQADVARVEVYAYALAPAGRVAGYLAEVFAADVGELGEKIWQSGLKFFGALSLAPGQYELRVLARNYQSGAFGFRHINVAVPEPEGEPPAGSIPPPLFPGPTSRDSWLAVRGRSERSQKAFSPYPLVVGDRSISPAARAVLVAGGPAEAYVFDLSLAEVDTTATVKVELFEEGEKGGRVGTSDAELVQAGQELLSVRFVSPEVSPGRYLLRLVIDGKAGLSRVSASVPVVLTGGGSRDRELLWSDLRSLLAGSALRTTPTEVSTESGVVAGGSSKRRSSGRAVRRLAKRYRAALAELREGSFETARVALFELESEVLAGSSQESFKHLRAAELLVAKELIEKDHDLALPILVLHAELGEVYRDRTLFSLAGHARVTVETVAELHAEHGGSLDLTAAALALEAGRLQQARLPAASRRLFARALEHDPDNAAALLGLGASLERYGAYSQAIGFLEQLVAARPDFGQAVLRLAINHLRVGRLGRAQGLLVKIVEGQGGDWVAALACQELARALLIAGDAEGGLLLLETALERMPEQWELRLLLAHIYDRTGRAERSLGELLQVGTSSEQGRGSARYRYDQWPQETLEEARELLAASALRASSRLAEVVVGDGGDAGSEGR
ncbi:MAG: hypothetical protein GY769_05710 [bacterium]|nr:hypothetical protein [bacterium]